jgi:photosystem II stability/assembly factor-like uncharacterized protein
MKTFLQILFFLLLLTQICFAQWYQQNSGTTKNLNAVKFTDANNGIAVGNNGTIIRTTDGGGEWVTQISGTTNDLYEVFSANTDTSYAVGKSGTILKTVDGGILWTQQQSGTDKSLSGLYFVDANNGWIGNKGMAYPDSINIILHTTDGGTNWNQQTYISHYGAGLSSVCFLDENIGYAGGPYGLVFKTTDGGVNWELKQQELKNKIISEVYFIDANEGWVVEYAPAALLPKVNSKLSFGLSSEEQILHTIDGGNTWTSQMDSLDAALFGVIFINKNIGFAVGITPHPVQATQTFSGLILNTTNGGINWSSQIIDTIQSLNSVYFIDVNNGWVVGDKGAILHTTNGGVTFIEEEKTNAVPNEFLLSQNFPNPFNPNTTIKYSIPNASKVTIKIFDVLGKEIETLVDEEKPIGTYELKWNATKLSSGVYFYQLKAGDFIQTKKMILLK